MLFPSSLLFSDKSFSWRCCKTAGDKLQQKTIQAGERSDNTCTEFSHQFIRLYQSAYCLAFAVEAFSLNNFIVSKQAYLDIYLCAKLLHLNHYTYYLNCSFCLLAIANFILARNSKFLFSARPYIYHGRSWRS